MSDPAQVEKQPSLTVPETTAARRRLRELPAPEPAAGIEAYEQERELALATSPRRRENYEKYIRSSRRSAVVDYLPIKLDIENVSRCNFRCTMCVVSDWPKGKREEDKLMDWDGVEGSLRQNAQRELNGRFDFYERQAGEKRQIVKEGLSEYFLYTVGGRDTIPSGWSKRLTTRRISPALGPYPTARFVLSSRRAGRRTTHSLAAGSHSGARVRHSPMLVRLFF